MTGSKDIFSFILVLFNIFLVISSLLFQHIPGNFQTKDFFSQFSQAVIKSHSSTPDLILLLHYFFISLFQSWCSQMVSFFLLSLRCTDISSLPHRINILSTSEKDIPPFSLTHHFFITHFLFSCCFCIFLLCTFCIMEQYESGLQMDVTNTTYHSEQGKDCFFCSPQKWKCLPKNGGTGRGINRKWWKTVMPERADTLQGHIRNCKVMFYLSAASLSYDFFSPLYTFAFLPLFSIIL